MMKRAFIGIVLAAMASGAAMGAQAQTKLRVGYAAIISSVPAMIAKDEGYFAKRNLDVELVWVVHGGTAIPALIANSLQIAADAPPVFIQSVANGLDIVSVAALTGNIPGQGGTSGLVAPKGSTIKTAKDLIGKKLGVISLAQGAT